MANYYYLVTQLPMLFFDHTPGITIPSFLDEARKWLTSSDFLLLKEIRLMDKEWSSHSPRLARDYQVFEKQFSDDLAAWRKARRNRQDYKPIFPLPLVREGNPLEIEKKLLHYRWITIEDLCIGHHFDLDFLSAYYLQLQILKRLSIYDKEKGMQHFQTLSRTME